MYATPELRFCRVYLFIEIPNSGFVDVAVYADPDLRFCRISPFLMIMIRFCKVSSFMRSPS